MRRLLTALAATMLASLVLAAPALACGGLIGPNGSVNLLRTTTFAGYHRGVEHYVTSFEFAGGGGAFGSLIPLPGVPTKVEKGGDWTLQRLALETNPVRELADFGVFAAAGASEARVLMTERIDALDVTVLEGGADEVGAWARNNGFRLPPDAPEVLEFYAQRSPIFLAAVFDADAAAAKGQAIGDGTPVHITMPTPNPWVPLRILALGKTGEERVEADVYLMTDAKPALLPGEGRRGLNIAHNQAASEGLLADLRSDRGMEWIPEQAWLTKIAIDARAADLGFDLAVDASGHGQPSRVAAGFDAPPPAVAQDAAASLVLGAGIVAVAIGLAAVVASVGRRRPGLAA
jgi:hypothetical protein